MEIALEITRVVLGIGLVTAVSVMLFAIINLRKSPTARPYTRDWWIAWSIFLIVFGGITTINFSTRNLWVYTLTGVVFVIAFAMISLRTEPRQVNAFSVLLMLILFVPLWPIAAPLAASGEAIYQLRICARTKPNR